jgi:hypothetical protein
MNVFAYVMDLWSQQWQRRHHRERERPSPIRPKWAKIGELKDILGYIVTMINLLKGMHLEWGPICAVDWTLPPDRLCLWDDVWTTSVRIIQMREIKKHSRRRLQDEMNLKVRCAIDYDKYHSTTPPPRDHFFFLFFRHKISAFFGNPRNHRPRKRKICQSP